jgi:hypothetical protein
LALAVVAIAHATPTFNAPSNTTVTDVGASGGINSSSLTGSVTNGGLGVTLSGNANTWSGGVTDLIWQGTGSGSFSGGTWGGNFTITAPGLSSWALNLTVNNGTPIALYTCNTGSCLTGISQTNQPFTVPAVSGNWTWKVDLTITSGLCCTLVVTIPPHASIDILGFPLTSSVPAVTPLALGATALLLLALGLCLAHGKYTRAPDIP